MNIIKKKKFYECPSVEVVSVKIEKGFATSSGTEQMEEVFFENGWE